MSLDINALAKELRKRPMVMEGSSVHPVEYGRESIERILPHRHPLLFVDAITHLDLATRRIQGKFLPRPDDPIFSGTLGEPFRCFTRDRFDRGPLLLDPFRV